MLTVAAVIAGFRLDVLQKVAGVSDEELFSSIDEAKKAAVIEERAAIGSAVTYRFTHAFFRKHYMRRRLPRRIRLHFRWRERWKRYTPNDLRSMLRTGRALLLFIRFNRLEKAVEYGEMAANGLQMSTPMGGCEVTKSSIKVQKVLDPMTKKAMRHAISTWADFYFIR